MYVQDGENRSHHGIRNIKYLNIPMRRIGSSINHVSGTACHDLENFCLAITDRAVSLSRNSARTPKFVSAGPSFFRTFNVFNFNNANFLSSGTSA